MTSARADHKASFSELYNQPDPRPYYRMLHGLDYQTPAHGQRAFGRLLETVQMTGDSPIVADLCCSYGIMSALLTCDVTFDDLYARYMDETLDDLSAEQLGTADRTWYSARRRADAPPVVGVDVAEQAVAYGERAGLLQPGFAENLETREPSEALAAALRPVRLVTISGGVSYITDRTISRLLACCEQPPWLAAFVLRTYDYGDIAAACARHDLVTERLEDVTFRQRRFATDDERAATLAKLTALGLDPSLETDDDAYHTHLYVSRPAAAADTPLTELLDGVA